MKKVFLLLIIALAVLTVFVACEKNPEFTVVNAENLNDKLGEYEYEDGMTWETFVKSSAYNKGFSIEDNTNYIMNGSHYIYYDTYHLQNVVMTDVISPMLYYFYTPSGS